MKQLLIWIVLLFVLCIVFAIAYLVYYNWFNSKIRDIAFSGVVFGLFISLIAIYNTLEEKTINEKFSCSIVYLKDQPEIQIQLLNINKDTSRAISLPYLPINYEMEYIIQEYNKEFPDNFDSKKIGFGFKVYSEVVAYFIISDLFKNYNISWVLDSYKFKSPNGTYGTGKPNLNVKSSKLKWKNLIKDVGGDIFKVKSLNTPNFFRDSIALPYGSTMELKSGKDDFFTIVIDNKYLHLGIIVHPYSGIQNAGDWGMAMKLNQQESDQFTGVNIMVEIDAKIKKLTSGSQTASQCEEWVNSIIRILKENLDYEEYRKKIRELRE